MWKQKLLLKLLLTLKFTLKKILQLNFIKKSTHIHIQTYFLHLFVCLEPFTNEKKGSQTNMFQKQQTIQISREVRKGEYLQRV